MLDPQQGDTFVLTRAFGTEPGAIPAGAQVEVVEKVDSGTPGVGGEGEDRYLLRHTFPSTVVDENGVPSEGVSSRHFGLTSAELTALVEEDMEEDNVG
jgi:hypothetical protein